MHVLSKKKMYLKQKNDSGSNWKILTTFPFLPKNGDISCPTLANIMLLHVKHKPVQLAEWCRVIMVDIDGRMHRLAAERD